MRDRVADRIGPSYIARLERLCQWQAHQLMIVLNLAWKAPWLLRAHGNVTLRELKRAPLEGAA